MSEDEPRVRFPVNCPICRKEVIAEYRAVDIVGALINGRPIHLYAACHDKSWIASYVEVQQIRGRLGERWLDEHRWKGAKGPSESRDD
jgi:hypothetical protein